MTSRITPDVVELKDMVIALLLDKKGQNQSPAPVKAVEESCVTCGGSHSYCNCPATDGNVYCDNIQEFVSQASAVNYNQGNTSYRPLMMSNQIRPPVFVMFLTIKMFNSIKRTIKTVSFQIKIRETISTKDLFINPWFSNFHLTKLLKHKVVENELEATKDTVNPTNNGSTKDIQPSMVLSESLILTSKPVTSPISEPVISSIFKDMSFEISFADALILMPKFASTLKALVGNKEKLSEMARTPLSLPDLTPTCMTLELADRLISCSVGVAEDVYVKRSFLKTGRALIDVFEDKLTLHVGKESITFNLDQTLRYSANYSDMTPKRIDIIDMACEEYSQDVLGFFDTISSGNPTPLYDLIISTTSSTLTPFENSDIHLEEELKIREAKSDKSSVDEPPKVELKDLPPHLEYVFLEGDDKLPVIIVNDLSMEEKTTFITVLKSHKRASAWKLSDIKRIDPEFCTHKILMEEDFEPAVQHQRRVNPKIYDVIKQERCMMAIFHDMIEKTMEVFMDDFNSFQSCLSYLERMLKRCEDTNLCLNWEKTHFMVNEGIILGHKISKQGIEVDKAKVDVITKLPRPTIVKGIRSFLGHAGFYRRFIKYFSKIARPMTRLLEKDTPFIFFQECVEVFQTLKRKLTEAPILIALDWDMPFELICNANDFVIGAVLGKRQDKHFRPIHYASKTMIEAESNYTIIEKEMLAVVHAFEKIRSYLIMNKNIVYTDHSALKYLFSKKDSKARFL
nr:reverse transcriptase domain-containing protein [Tanacetum cinerariifolium]